MKLTLGFSTCPNDTFIFDAMIYGKVNTEGLEFEVIMADVEELNRNASAGLIDITKLSYFAYASVAENYRLLTSGSALGYKNGPLLIAKNPVETPELINRRIAIPGKNTTANLLFSSLFPKAENKVEVLFSKIEDAVLRGEVDAGVIIHESRFTYQEKGLLLIADLGELWELKTGNPIPLGGIVVNQRLDISIQQKINRVMKRSVEYAFANPLSSKDFVKIHACEMDDNVIQKHIGLYVNNFTVDLGETGKNAVRLLYEKAFSMDLISAIPVDIFVE